MAIIKWKQVYETGIVVLDKEHQELVKQINVLFEAVRDKRGNEVYADVVAMLDVYVLEHFAHEERLMQEYQFSGFEEHQQEHQRLVAAVEKRKTDHAAMDESAARELLNFLRTWLLEHIVKVDKRYGSFIESRGGRFVD
ncbi:bacteriohemerythrin [Pelovirga terrestris]|uniref:Hemerythrin family protein n=1 Tax=Pelovirga terrestris TaxID=2771352 RepID=A0A8J6UHT7_9BACT|nr:bacteriohemerythrin [Pelovirga terrestris]MBD1399810.1 hemerythrin family protein [Pelovirga terrestris]